MEARFRLSERERRLLVLVAVGLVIGLYASLAFVPLLERYLAVSAQLRAAMEAAAPGFGRASAAPAGVGGPAGAAPASPIGRGIAGEARARALEREAAALRTRLEGLRSLMPGRLDGAALIEDLEAMADAASVRVAHLDLGSPAAAGGEVRQEVKVELAGTVTGHLAFLEALGRRPWLMRIQGCRLAEDAMACDLSFFLGTTGSPSR